MFNHRLSDCQGDERSTGGELVENVTPVALLQARQHHDPAAQRAAMAWLRVCCPDIADEIEPTSLDWREVTMVAFAPALPQPA